MRDICDQVICYNQQDFGGLKAISFATKTINDWEGYYDFEDERNREWLESELTYVATCGLSDIMREDVKHSIIALEETKTWVRILSGDHMLAVKAFADKLEMTSEESNGNDIISGEELIAQLSPMLTTKQDTEEGRGKTYLFKDKQS